MPEHVKLASRIVSYRAVKTTRRWWLVGRPCVCVSIGRIVQNVIDSSLKTKYIVAVDDSNNTLEEITRVDLTSELHSRIAEKNKFTWTKNTADIRISHVLLWLIIFGKIAADCIIFRPKFAQSFPRYL